MGQGQSPNATGDLLGLDGGVVGREGGRAGRARRPLPGVGTSGHAKNAKFFEVGIVFRCPKKRVRISTPSELRKRGCRFPPVGISASKTMPTPEFFANSDPPEVPTPREPGDARPAWPKCALASVRNRAPGGLAAVLGHVWRTRERALPRGRRSGPGRREPRTATGVLPRPHGRAAGAV